MNVSNWSFESEGVREPVVASTDVLVELCGLMDFQVIGLSYRQAFLDCVKQVECLERLLGVSLRVGGDYLLKSRREHNAHTDRLVARESVRDGRKFVVWDDVGVWVRVDCSTGVPELETEAGGSEDRIEHVRDASRLVREDFNTLKDKGITREFLLEQDARIQAKLESYADNIATHVRVMQRIEVLLRRLDYE